MRPSCSVIEQKEQPPKQPRIMLTENGSFRKPEYGHCHRPDVARACMAAQNAVHLFGRKRNSRRVDPHIAVAVFLHQCAGTAWVGFVVQNTRSMGVQHFIALHFLERQQHVGFSHGFGRGGCTVTALASCFSVPPVCYPRTANLHHTDAGLGRFFQGYQDGWNPRRSSQAAPLSR